MLDLSGDAIDRISLEAMIHERGLAGPWEVVLSGRV